MKNVTSKVYTKRLVLGSSKVLPVLIRYRKFLIFETKTYISHGVHQIITLLQIFKAYEEPDNPELSLRTVGRTIKETVQELINLLEDKV